MEMLFDFKNPSAQTSNYHTINIYKSIQHNFITLKQILIHAHVERERERERERRFLKCSLAKANTTPEKSSSQITSVQCPSIMMKLHGNNLQHLHHGHCCGANASLPRTHRCILLPQGILGVWVTKGTNKNFCLALSFYKDVTAHSRKPSELHT